MYIKNMFAKPIDRNIKGVIKVGQGDDENVKQELEEYVVTRLQNTLQIFFLVIKEELLEIQMQWVFGFLVSLEVVNRIS